MSKDLKKFSNEDIQTALEITHSEYFMQVIGLLSHDEDNKEFNSQFEYFKKLLSKQIEVYSKKIRSSEKEAEIGDFGFFTDAIKKLRTDST